VTNNGMTDTRDRAEAMRDALIQAGLAAYEDAGFSGLCHEGRWEAAVAAMRGVDVAASTAAGAERPSGLRPTNTNQVADLVTNLAGVLDAVTSTTLPPPSGGSVAAAAGALAAALTQMVAGLTAGRPKYAHVVTDMEAAARSAAGLATELSVLVRRDATAVEAVTAAYRLPKRTEEDAAARAAAIEHAMLRATEVPLEIARATATVAELAADVATRGNTNAVADAAVAVLLAESVCSGASLTVRINAALLRDTPERLRLLNQASAVREIAANATRRALGAVDRAP
jgi:glutamate formiminotransferase/formiminotetrahydrofolate cyclodeaminase